MNSAFPALLNEPLDDVVVVTRQPWRRDQLAPPNRLPRLEAIDCLRGAGHGAHGPGPCALLFGDDTVGSHRPVAPQCGPVPHALGDSFLRTVFCFLAGAGAFLSTSRGRTRPHLAGFLLSRGLWLVVLEFTVVQFCWSFAWDCHALRCQVLWALGCSMALLAGAVFLPSWAVLACGITLLSVDQTGLLVNQVAAAPWVRVVLISGGSIRLMPEIQFVVTYPILPWFGVMAVGFGLGPLWGLAHAPRRRWLLTLGTMMTLLFILLRAFSHTQGPHAWTNQSNSLFTLFSFLNCRKYPPSLPYVLMTLGPALIVLAVLDREPRAWQRCLVTFGRVPLMFYVLHLPVFHVLAHGVAYCWNHVLPGLSQLVDGSAGWLVLVYLSWMGGLLLLYPACRWYLAVKRRRREHALVRYL